MRDSVTVSIAEEMTGIFIVTLRETRVWVFVSDRNDVAVRREEQYIVEGQSFRNWKMNHVARSGSLGCDETGCHEPVALDQL